MELFRCFVQRKTTALRVIIQQLNSVERERKQGKKNKSACKIIDYVQTGFLHAGI